MTTKKSSNGYPFTLYKVDPCENKYTATKKEGASSVWRLDDPEYGIYESVGSGELCGFVKVGKSKIFSIAGIY